MSELLINQYHAEIAKYIQYGGDKKETSIRRAFANLLSTYCKPHDLTLVDELEYTTKLNTRVVPDGTIKDALRLTHGYWEAKDESDDIDVEIEKKLKKGYPSDNILFEDSITAVLLQNNTEVMRVSMKDAAALDKLVRRFIEFERPELQTFRQAIAQFKQDMPEVLHALRQMIDANQISNANFKTALQTFLKLCQDNINADIVLDDAREMLIQHILTEDIFNTVFGDTQFHRENNIARELQKVADTFFTGSTKKNTLKGLESYYGAIKQSASGIANHHEKQQFLKAIYENFYKVYNPKLADRLGVVYTPNEIVRFMIESTEALIHQHFGKLLISRGVEILDPATGTGTFITDLIEHFKHNKDELAYKYKNELHCNEVAILPYYIANLNIEFTYSQIMNEYAEFPNICFVDTLDNLGFKHTHKGAQDGFDFGMTAVNTERVKAQNSKKISVIIGNPPYNANQKSENDDNQNRKYPKLDSRIKQTYLAMSSAQKTKLYEPLVRFLRWSSDRIHEQGVVSFVINRAFIDKVGYDGFRKTVANEFNEIYVLDLGGDWREGEEIGGGNVFGISIGVAIIYLVRNPKSSGSSVLYKLLNSQSAEDKLSELSSLKFNEIEFTRLSPDENGIWINQTNNNFSELLPVANLDTRNSHSGLNDSAIFKLYSLGVSTNRDSWIVDVSKSNLTSKIKYFLSTYKEVKSSKLGFIKSIKWSETLKQKFKRGEIEKFSQENIATIQYRPFTKLYFYDSYLLVDRPGHKKSAFSNDNDTNDSAIAFTDSGSQKPFMVGASNCFFDLHFVGSAAGTTYLSYYRYDENGNRTGNHPLR